MGNNFANSDGTWSDESVAYYGERAKGQFGLITIEATVVHKGAKGGPAGVKIQCFGNFEIFVNGRTLAFKRSKSKELLAYLVDRNGVTCTNGEMLAVLWEDKPDTASLHSHLRNLIFDLSHALEDAGVTGLLIRGRSTLAIDTGKVDCDYYNFLKGDRSAINSYRGEYMTQYSWAEVTRSALRQQASAQKTASIPSYYAPTEF